MFEILSRIFYDLASHLNRLPAHFCEEAQLLRTTALKLFKQLYCETFSFDEKNFIKQQNTSIKVHLAFIETKMHIKFKQRHTNPHFNLCGRQLYVYSLIINAVVKTVFLVCNTEE